MKITELQKRLILHWGETAKRWGLKRSVGQTHALLYLAERPLNAKQIAACLELAPASVSTGLRTLLSLGWIQRRPVDGVRGAHFSAHRDLGQLLRGIAAARRRRDVDPSLALLQQLLRQPAASRQDRYAQAQLQSIYTLLQSARRWLIAMERQPADTLAKLHPSRNGARPALE